MEQSIALPGVGNARELGGYSIGNQKIKSGVLLRTAGLNRIEPSALEALQNRYRVQTVIDLRMSTERHAQPDPETPGAQNLHLPVMELAEMAGKPGIGSKLAEIFSAPTPDRMALFDAVYEAGLLNDQLYIPFLLGERGRRAYRAFFEALLQLEEGRAILWHCTDGKDRTGCAAMLTLFALGADRETVYHDYLLTNVFNAPALEAVRQKVAPLGLSPEKLDALLFMSGAVREAYMDSALDALNREYGGARGYLTEALGLGQPELEALRHKFLSSK